VVNKVNWKNRVRTNSNSHLSMLSLARDVLWVGEGLKEREEGRERKGRGVDFFGALLQKNDAAEIGDI
jgi:hypothetical protein